MTPSDTQRLHDFLGQLVQARGIQKDQQADALIQEAVAQQPDAAYLLVQRALLMQQALDTAKSRIAMLESQQGNSNGNGGGFLDPNSRGKRKQPQQHQQQSRHTSWQHAMPSPSGHSGSGSSGSRGGGLLGSIAATAAGVAAGSFLFHGLDNLLHDHDSGGNAGHLLSDSDQSGSALADQAGLNDVGQSDSLPGDEGGIESNGGFFDGDGSDEGVFG